jgi:uncharacterized protein YuzE
MRDAIAVFCDILANVAHIELAGSGEIVRSVRACDDGRILLDFNAKGQLIGIELLDLCLLHPDLVSGAIQMGLIDENDA